MHHVGDHYDLSIAGNSARIVVVGQEYGHGPPLVDSDARRKMIMESALLPRGFAGRNPHMRGTTIALRILLGTGLGDDREGEWIQVGEERFHLFEAFSLANYLLCSATDGSTRGQATARMLRNCSGHFRRALEILDPTLVIVQGKSFFPTVASMLGVPKKPDQVLEFRLGDAPGLCVGLNHPSTPRWQHGWARLEQPYLQNTVAPLLSEMREEVVGRAAQI